MAVDLRYSRSRPCREWLEGVLLELEGEGVLEATRERFPPHYHVAVFPRQYAAYVAAIAERPATMIASTIVSPMDRDAYRVRAGDSLWTIARRHRTTVDQLRALNELEGSRIYAGQVLDVPSAG
jgi:Tfp pilus assembly protein FimV